MEKTTGRMRLIQDIEFVFDFEEKDKMLVPTGVYDVQAIGDFWYFQYNERTVRLPMRAGYLVEQ